MSTALLAKNDLKQVQEVDVLVFKYLVTDTPVVYVLNQRGAQRGFILTELRYWQKN